MHGGVATGPSHPPRKIALVLHVVIAKQQSTRPGDSAVDFPPLSLQSSLVTTQLERRPLHQFLIGVAIFLAGFLTHFPFRTRYLNGWDTGQFVLAAYRFDVPNHQPHPSGYILYVGLLRHLISILHDESLCLGLLSVTFAALSGVLVFLLALEFFAEKRTAYLAACLWLVNPLLWYYSLTGDVYTAGAFGSLLTALCVHRFWREPSERTAILAAASFAFSGGLRPDLVIFLFPLLLLPFWRSRPCRRFFPLLGAVAILGYLSWYIPMLVLSGGYQNYSHALREHFLLSVQRTSVLFGAPPMVHARMIVRMLGAIFAGTFVLLVLVLPLVAYRGRKLRGPGLKTQQGLFILVWTVPALVFMSLVHFGRGGYLFPFLPALILILARWVTIQIPPPPRGRGLFVAASLLPALAQTCFFFAGPGLGTRLPPEPVGKAHASLWLNRLELIPYLFRVETRTYVYESVRRADAPKKAYLSGIAEAVGRGSTTLVCLEPAMWRILMNYFPHVPIFAVFGFDEPIPEKLGRPGPLVVALGYERETRILFDGSQATVPGRRASISWAGRQNLLFIAPSEMKLEILDAPGHELIDITPVTLPLDLKTYKLITFHGVKGKGVMIGSAAQPIALQP